MSSTQGVRNALFTVSRQWAWGLLLLGACARPLEEPAYKEYLQDPAHGLTHQIEVGAARIQCTYRPAELLVAQELRLSELAATGPVVDSLQHQYAGKAHFLLELSRTGSEIENQFVNDRGMYSSAVNYLNSGIAADVSLTLPHGKPIPAVAASYIRQFSATGRSSVLLMFNFDSSELKNGFSITFQDQFFGLGTVRFPFSAHDIESLPSLRFK